GTRRRRRARAASRLVRVFPAVRLLRDRLLLRLLLALRSHRSGRRRARPRRARAPLTSIVQKQESVMALVDYEVKGHVAIVTLHRPDARNAITPEVAVRLADAFVAARDDDNVRVIVLTGKGSAFCAGADLGQLIPMMSGARKPENEFDHRVLKEPGITSRAL